MAREAAQFHASIHELDPGAWNALGAAANPFTRHEFLAALERNRLRRRAHRLAAALPRP